MKPSIFRPFGLKMPIHAPEIGVLGVFHPQHGEQCRRKPKRHICGRNGSGGVLITSLFAIVPEKSRGNKKCDGEEEEEEEERHILAFLASL